MGRLNREFLEAIAKAYLAWPVVVRAVPRGNRFLGELDNKGTAPGSPGYWEISLCESLAAEGRDQLARSFFHEVGHAACGHMDRITRERKPSFSPDEWRREKGESMAQYAQGLEDAAWAWAEEKLAEFEQRYGVGTFERLAIIEESER